MSAFSVCDLVVKNRENFMDYLRLPEHTLNHTVESFMCRQVGVNWA